MILFKFQIPGSVNTPNEIFKNYAATVHLLEDFGIRNFSKTLNLLALSNNSKKIKENINQSEKAPLQPDKVQL